MKLRLVLLGVVEQYWRSVGGDVRVYHALGLVVRQVEDRPHVHCGPSGELAPVQVVLFLRYHMI